MIDNPVGRHIVPIKLKPISMIFVAYIYLNVISRVFSFLQKILETLIDIFSERNLDIRYGKYKDSKITCYKKIDNNLFISIKIEILIKLLSEIELS